MNELRIAARRLYRQPSFTLAAVGALTLGIAAATSIFAAVQAALLRPLAFPDADDLYTLRTTITTGRMTSGLVAPVELEALHAPSGAIADATGVEYVYDSLVERPGQAAQVKIGNVTRGFFDVFAAPMAFGRAFRPEDHVRGAARVVVLSHHLWESAFGTDPSVIGRRLALSRGAFEIIGVAPAGLEDVSDADAFANDQVDPRNVSHVYTGYMRVQHGAAAAGVQQQLRETANRLAREFPVFNTDRVYVTRPLLDALLGDLKPTLIVTMGAALTLLLLACVNVSNLLLARGTARTHEIATRAALGASPRRIARELMIESLLISALAASAGVWTARVSAAALRTIASARLPRLETIALDWPVLLFSVIAALAATIVIGAIPAVRLMRTNMTSMLREQDRGATGRAASRTLSALIVSEVALAIVLTASAGWLVQAFRHVSRTPIGFDSRGRLVADVFLPADAYRDPASIATWTDSALERVRAIPRVVAAGSSSSLPLKPERDSTVNFTLPEDPAPQHPPAAWIRGVTPGWFEAMGVHVSGRTFQAQDAHGGAPVAIVNDALAHRYLDGRDPLRARLRIRNSFVGGGEEGTPPLAIVGVADDMRYASVAAAAEPTFYVCRLPGRRQTFAIATSTDDPTILIPQVRAVLQAENANVPIQFDTLPSVVSTSLSRQRLGMLLMQLFAGAALLLAGVGVYAVAAFAVARRVREIGTRLALGATRASIVWMVLKRELLLAVAGTLVGAAGAVAAGRLLTTEVAAVHSLGNGPIVLAILVVMTGVTLGTLQPALRAGALDPLDALRRE